MERQGEAERPVIRSHEDRGNENEKSRSGWQGGKVFGTQVEVLLKKRMQISGQDMMVFDSHKKEKRTIEFSDEAKIIRMIQEALQPFRPFLHGYKVILFGSRVTRKKRGRSDYDLGVFGEEALSEKIFFSIEDALEQLPTLHQIDWVNLNQVSRKFFEYALKNAKVLYE